MWPSFSREEGRGDADPGQPLLDPSIQPAKECVGGESIPSVGANKRDNVWKEVFLRWQMDSET